MQKLKNIRVNKKLMLIEREEKCTMANLSRMCWFPISNDSSLWDPSKWKMHKHNSDK